MDLVLGGRDPVVDEQMKETAVLVDNFDIVLMAEHGIVDFEVEDRIHVVVHV